MATENDNQLAVQVESIEKTARAVVVRSDAERTIAVGFVKDVKAMRANVVGFFKDMKEKTYAAWKSVTTQETAFTSRCDAAEKTVKAAIVAYDSEQERKREEERRRLQAEADERARKEREALEKKAAQMKTPEKREEYLERASEVAAPKIAIPEPVRPENTSTQRPWKARVVNAEILPRLFLVPDQKALDDFAKATKGAEKVAGVEFYQEARLVIR